MDTYLSVYFGLKYVLFTHTVFSSPYALWRSRMIAFGLAGPKSPNFT